MNIKIYTDGAFSSLRKQGGIGIVILKDNEEVIQYSNCFKNTTNNQMELIAIIVALRFIKDECDSIIIYSDSQYCIGCATLGWKRRKNIKLWSVFDKEFDRVKTLCNNITFQHVKGHQSNLDIHSKYNNICDELAVKASQLL